MEWDIWPYELKIHSVIEQGWHGGRDCSYQNLQWCMHWFCGGKRSKAQLWERERKESYSISGLVHSYLIGPLPTPSYGGSRYVLNFIDYFSMFWWVYFLKLKYEVFEILKFSKALVQNACGNNIKVLRNHNGNEYVNNHFQQLCEECAIQMQHLVPYTP